MTRRSAWVVAAGLLVALTGGVDAADPGREPAGRMLEEAHHILADLQKRNAFTQPYRCESLLTQCAILRYRSHPDEALAEARGLSEPFFASLAIGGMASQQIERDAKTAEELLMEAQRRALAIDHWMGSDATSLGYLFQVVPLFERKQAAAALAASRVNLKAWEGDAFVKSRAMLELSRVALVVDPSLAGQLLQDARRNPQSNHYYESIKLLSRTEASRQPQRTTEQVAAFYRSGRDLPAEDDPIVSALVADAMRDVPAACERIKTLKEDQQNRLLYELTDALAEDGRKEEAMRLLEQLEARAKGNATEVTWLHGGIAHLQERLRARQPQAVSVAEIDGFLGKPSAELLREITREDRPLTFRDARQAKDFVAAARPLAPQVQPLLGAEALYWDMQRLAAMGVLTRVCAILGDVDAALQIAGQVDTPELRAMYLLQAEEDLHPLPEVMRGWPIHYMPAQDIRIGK